MIIRADVVTGCEYNLVDSNRRSRASLGCCGCYWCSNAVGAEPVATWCGDQDLPGDPHQAHCFITEDEYPGFPLHEYSPPGRHPKSPGANPWG